MLGNFPLVVKKKRSKRNKMNAVDMSISQMNKNKKNLQKNNCEGNSGRLRPSNNNSDPFSRRSQSPVAVRSLSDPVWSELNDEQIPSRGRGWNADYSALKTLYTPETTAARTRKGGNWNSKRKDMNSVTLNRAKAGDTAKNSPVASKPPKARINNEQRGGAKEVINTTDSAKKTANLWGNSVNGAVKCDQFPPPKSQPQEDSSQKPKTPNPVNTLNDTLSNFYFADDRSLGVPISTKEFHGPQSLLNAAMPTTLKAPPTGQGEVKSDGPSVERPVGCDPIDPGQTDANAIPPLISGLLGNSWNAAHAMEMYNQYLSWQLLFASAENNRGYVHDQIDNPLVQQLVAIIASNPFVYNLTMVYLWQQNLIIQKQTQFLMQILGEQHDATATTSATAATTSAAAAIAMMAGATATATSAATAPLQTGHPKPCHERSSHHDRSPLLAHQRVKRVNSNSKQR